MKKSFLKSVSVVLVLTFAVFGFSACRSDKEVARVSKNLTSYNIEAKLDEENMTVLGKEIVKVVNNTDVLLEKLVFNFYARAFSESATVKPYTAINEGKVFPHGKNFGDGTITKVSLEGKQVGFSYEGEDNLAFSIALEKPLEPKDASLVEIEFSVKLAECTHRLGFINGSVNLGHFFPMLAVYEKGEFITSPYYSTGDPFYSELANFSVKFTAPSEYEFSSTGEVKLAGDDQGLKTFNATSRATRDFTINLLKGAKRAQKTVDGVRVFYTGYEGDSNIEENLAIAVKALNFYSKTFGAYPYKTLSVVKAPFVHGGMEYPNMVIISDTIVEPFDIAKVIAHEIAHQWWYGVVGNNQITEAWLDESLAEYSTVLFFDAHREFEASYEELVSEAFSIYTLYADIAMSTNGEIKTAMNLPVNEYNSEYEYSYMVYVKGILMFDSLSDTIGRTRLIKCFKKYYSAYKFKTAKSDDLIATFRKASGRDIEGFFDSWLQGKTIIGTI